MLVRLFANVASDMSKPKRGALLITLYGCTSSPQEFFENPAFRPDGLKLYPTLVIRGTGLYELWKTGRYKSYTPSDLVDLVARVLALVPPWTRVYRVQR